MLTKYEIKKSIAIKDYDEIYRRTIELIIFSLGLSVVAFIFGRNNLIDENDGIWFQRSGSLMVVFVLFAEYQYIKLQELVSSKLIDYGDGKYLTQMQHIREQNFDLNYDPTFKILFQLPILSIGIIGTVIWGYGDLLYNILSLRNIMIFYLVSYIVFFYLLIRFRKINKN